MALKDLSKEQLISKIKSYESLIDQMKKDEKEELTLNFGWTGNLGRWYWEFENDIVRFNKLKVETLGYKIDEIPNNIGYRFFTDKIHPEDYDKTMKIMREHLSGERKVYEVEYRIRTKEGNWKWFYDRGKITKRDSQGRPLLLAGIVFDITQRKEMEKKLEQNNIELKRLNQKKNEFLGIAAHDLRTPIANIYNLTDILEEELNENVSTEIKDILELIAKISQDMLEIINYFLDYSKIESGQIQLNKKKNNYTKMLREMFSIYKQFAAKKEIELDLEICDFVPIFKFDEKKIKQVLYNLLSNAIKYSHRNTQIVIEIAREGNFVITKVIDQGIGVEEGFQKAIFEPFDKSGGSPTANEDSTGMGLYICKQMVEKHGGEIGVYSNREKGATFYFSLPLN